MSGVRVAGVPIRAIASDLDGTLVPGATYKISQRTIDIFQKAHEAGIVVILASGRNGPSMRSFIETIGSKHPYIASNGAETYDAEHNLIRSLTIDVETAREVVDFMRERNMYLQTYYGDTFYYDWRNSPIADRYRAASGIKGEYVRDLRSFIDRPVAKLLGVDDATRVRSVIKECEKAFEGRLAISTSESNFLEVGPLGASKGAALEALAQTGLIERETTLAIGDSINDMPMLMWAGVSVAMGNARDEVKAAATYVCETCENDGAACIIEELLGLR